MIEFSRYALSPLREGDFTLYRGSCDGMTPILLVAAEESSLGCVGRLKHEYALKAELDADWAARPVALTRYDDRMTLVLEDPGGAPVDRLLGRPLDISRFLRIANPLAGALRRVHERGLIHRDIKPANILADTASGGVWLTGFGIASRLPREHQVPAPPEVIAGTLAYMAPEQTGRMNRSVDSRSDLYALGVTFYEMLTGQLPFTAADPMEWVHCHIARQPMPPDERVGGVPGPLSAIVMKLLAKTGEERYQTAAGVEVDLQRCLADLESYGRIDEFPLGEHDKSDRLLIPERLYGRESEINTLLASFDRVVAGGNPELVLVSGYSGVGKSSVVNELHRPLVPPRGLFASGKFDQFKRDIPYATLAQAFQSLLRPLLSKSEGELSKWRGTLREALDPNGQLIVGLVPELELIIGEQPPVSELPPQDAQNRFQLVFRRFISVFTREHPLALFLDDLQWLDAATLDLMEDLLTRSDMRRLMLIGAYRDNEVNSTHPLMRKLEAIRFAGATVHDIVLAPLAREDLGRLVADSLHCQPERAEPLADLIYEKTAGNPFFVIQFIQALAEEALISFDRDKGRWYWDLHRIHAKGYTDNVVDLMVGRLNRLPTQTQKALQQLACLGNSADFAMLCMVSRDSNEEMHGQLWEAVRTGLIFQSEDSYRFLHDRVHEAAYSLIPEGARPEAHLRIGRLLAASVPPEKHEEAIFEIVSQLNRGVMLMTSAGEREQLAQFNLIAGKRAQSSTAYTSALNYLEMGAGLLAEDCWQRCHDLIFSIELARAQCEFMSGVAEKAEKRLSMLADRATTTIEKSTVAGLRVDLYMTIDRSDRSVTVGLEALRNLGIDWSPSPTEEEVRYEYNGIWSQLAGRAIEDLADSPLMTDPISLITLDLLVRISVPAYFASSTLFAVAACRAVSLSLLNGNCDASCIAYVQFAMLAGPYFGNYDAGYHFGRLGCELVERPELKRFQTRTLEVFGWIMSWTRPVRGGRVLLARALDVANRTGDIDITYSGYGYCQIVTSFLLAGDPLVEAQQKAEDSLKFAESVQFGVAIAWTTGQLRLIRTLRGLTSKFGSFDEVGFDELEFERYLAANPALALPECWYWIRKAQARFLAGDYVGALEASAKAEPMLWASLCLLEMVEFHFYDALSHAAACNFAATDQRDTHLEKLAAHQKQLEIWAQSCPENFQTRAALVNAEIARIEGRELDAEQLYERAILSARESGFVHNEALSSELAARFYALRGFETISNAYLRKARNCYISWGAFGKVRQLEQLHPNLRDAPAAASPITTIGAPAEQLDVGTVLKAAQAVSGEIVLGELIKTLLRIAVEHAGAERGLLILFQDDEPQTAAEATTGRGQVEVTLHPTAAAPAELPVSVLHTVIRTRESVILDDALAQNPFSQDQYLCQKRARSVLCLPLVKQSKLIGVLYLENNLASHVFTPARISVLELLASQAAISLENARLYTISGKGRPGSAA